MSAHHRELVDTFGDADIAADLDKRDGWPLEEDFLTGGMTSDDEERTHWRHAQGMRVMSVPTGCTSRRCGTRQRRTARS